MTEVEKALRSRIGQIMAMNDPRDRGAAAAQLIRDLDAAHESTVSLRKAAVDEMRRRGMSHAQVAEVIGTARGTASQIARGKQTGRRPPERD